MQIIRTIIWVLIAVALLVFSINNWTPVTVKIWEGLVLETKTPALVIIAFLAGLVPMWLVHRGAKWRLERRIATLENAMRAATATPAVAVETKTDTAETAEETAPRPATTPTPEAS